MVQPRSERARQEALRRLAQMGTEYGSVGGKVAGAYARTGVGATGAAGADVGAGATRGNVVSAAARRAAAFTLASTLGAFGSSQLTVETALAAEAAAGIVAESPAAVASSGAGGADSAGASGASGGAGSASGDASGKQPGGTATPAPDAGGTGSASGSSGAGGSDGSADSTGDSAAGSGSGAAPGDGTSTPDATPGHPVTDPDSASDSDASDDLALVDAAAGDPTNPDDPDADIAPVAATLSDRIQEALAASSSAVVALEDGDALDAQVAVPAGKQLTVDLNGRALSASAGGAAFKLGGGSTLTIIDNSAGKGGSISTGAALVEQDEFDYTKCNLVVQSGSISCSTLVGFANCAQVTLAGGSVSMSSTMRVTSDVWVDIKGSCSVRSSASDCAFRIAGGGSVTTLANAHVTYTGGGTMFRLLKGGVLELGSGASCGVVLNASNGSIVTFDNSSVNASYNGATIVCGKDHPVFASGSAGAGATVKFVSGTLPDDSIKSFLSAGSFCVYEPNKGFVVCGQSFVNDNCIGMADDVYYYTEDSFANASGTKVRFLLVDFSFNAADFAGTAQAGKTAHIHVPPGTELRNAPLFALMDAPARDGFTFEWVLESTGAGYLPDEVLAMPIVAGKTYSFVGCYVADAVDPGPGPVDPDPGPVDPGPGPVDPVDPVDPGPVDPGPVNPPDPGPDGGEGSGGTGGGAGLPGGPSPANPFMPWNPPGLAAAAGFTVPASGPGVVARPLEAVAAGAGAGDGGDAGDALAEAAAEALVAARGAEGEGEVRSARGAGAPAAPFPASGLATVAALAAGVALMALLASRAAAFLSANAAAARRAPKAPRA